MIQADGRLFELHYDFYKKISFCSWDLGKELDFQIVKEFTLKI